MVGTHSDKMTSVKQQAELGENLKLIAKLYGDLDNQIAGMNVRICNSILRVMKILIAIDTCLSTFPYIRRISSCCG